MVRFPVFFSQPELLPFDAFTSFRAPPSSSNAREPFIGLHVALIPLLFCCFQNSPSLLLSSTAIVRCPSQTFLLSVTSVFRPSFLFIPRFLLSPVHRLCLTYSKLHTYSTLLAWVASCQHHVGFGNRALFVHFDSSSFYPLPLPFGSLLSPFAVIFNYTFRILTRCINQIVSSDAILSLYRTWLGSDGSEAGDVPRSPA